MKEKRFSKAEMARRMRVRCSDVKHTAQSSRGCGS
jgi:hypothetical protein